MWRIKFKQNTEIEGEGTVIAQRPGSRPFEQQRVATQNPEDFARFIAAAKADADAQEEFTAKENVHAARVKDALDALEPSDRGA